MSDEMKNEIPEVEAPITELDVATAVTPEPEKPAAPQQDPSVTQPQVIIQKERGFAHYVGFAIIFVLCVCFYFAPGIALTYALNLVPGVSLVGMTSWIISAIFSVVVWLIFKLKIKGFKKSFRFYIGVCVLVVAILIAAEVLTEQTNVFPDIFAMLTGGLI